jgi:predicted nucleic acid-binding protein
MTFADLQAGDAIFVDANILIYHYTKHPKYGAACTALLERVERKEITAFTSSHCLADVAHRVMTIEAMSRLGWPVSGLAARLKNHRTEIPKLRLYQQTTVNVGRLGVQVLPVSELLVVAATHMSQQFELLTGDALIVTVMQTSGLSRLASCDADFDRVPGLTRYAPA